jgi:UDP-glucose 4-epimerase
LLITGGAGFIGSNLAAAALDSDALRAVRVLDDFSTGSPRNLDRVDVEIVEGSLLDPDALNRALRNIDAVVHLAAIPSVPRSLANPVASHAANATGTLLLLEACRAHGVSYVAAASSSSVYGSNPALPKHEREWVRPLSPYAVSKLATEQYLLAYQSSFGLQTLPFRFFNVYGPGQAAGHAYAAVIPAFVDAVLAGRPLRVNGTGTQSRDFTYVGTVCDILLDTVVRRVVSPEPVNLAFGSRTTLLELVELVEEVTGRPATVERGPVRAGDVPHSQADNAALRALFPGVVPTELRVGLERTVSWFCAGMAR